MLQIWFLVNTLFWPWNLPVGNMKLSLSVIVLMLAGVYQLGSTLKVKTRIFGIIAVFSLYAFLSACIVLAGPCRSGLLKMMTTVPALILLLLFGLEVGNRAKSGEWIKLQRTAKWTLALAFIGFVVEMVYPNKFPNTASFRAKGELSGIYFEPSQVAIALFPSVAVLLTSECKKTRRLGMIAVLGILLFSHSTTMLALTVTWVFYRLFVQRKLRQTALLVSGLVFLVVVGASVDYTSIILPTVVRVAGVLAPGETGDLSSLVYIKGWQDAWFSLTHTYGMGMGLNMMGCGPLPDVSARDAVLLVTRGIELNAQDGSFVFAKLISETGILGLTFYVVVVWWWFKLETKIRSLGKSETRFALSTQAALIFCFVATSFIRGSGYFDAWFLIGVAAAGGAMRDKTT